MKDIILIGAGNRGTSCATIGKDIDEQFRIVAVAEHSRLTGQVVNIKEYTESIRNEIK